jgi:hypothetical protein
MWEEQVVFYLKFTDLRWVGGLAFVGLSGRLEDGNGREKSNSKDVHILSGLLRGTCGVDWWIRAK